MIEDTDPLTASLCAYVNSNSLVVSFKVFVINMLPVGASAAAVTGTTPPSPNHPNPIDFHYLIFTLWLLPMFAQHFTQKMVQQP